MFSKDKELVWLRATRSQHTNATRITHQAAMHLGFAQSVTKAYQIQLRPSSEPRFALRAEGVETLECTRSRGSSAGRDRQVAGLEQGAAIRDERMGSLGADTPGSDHARY